MLASSQRCAWPLRLGGIVAITAGISERCVTHAGAANLNSALKTDEDRHVTVVASSGDNGAAGGPCSGVVPASVRAVNLPASDPLVLAVGGTTLKASPQPGPTSDETAWNVPAVSLPAGAPKPPASALAQLLATGSNGGFSSLFSRPAYQDGVPGIGHMRGVPDVSADAGSHTGMAVAFSLTPGNVVTSADGTSAGAPFWAGIVALADQDARHALGFINPTIYRIGRSSSYHRAFHDITTGSNTITFPAGTVTGYQAAPGLGPRHRLGNPRRSESSFPCSQLENRSGELLGGPRPHRALQFYGRNEGSGEYRRAGPNAMGFEPPEPK